MKLIIDRFEGVYAVCEDENKNMTSVLKSRLPGGAEEGSILEMADDLIIADSKKTDRRKKTIKARMDGMWSK